MTEPTVNILLAEDCAPDVFLIREALNLRNLPVTVHTVDDGEKAIEFFELADEDESAPRPDILILDLNLPKRSGAEVLQRMRGSSKCGQIPVIVITSSDSPSDRETATRLGANRYFQKPIHYEEFMRLGEIVSDVIREHCPVP